MNEMVFVFVGFIIRKNTFPGYDKIRQKRVTISRCYILGKQFSFTNGSP